MKCEGIPAATAARLPLYLRGLRELSLSGADLISSRGLSEITGLEAYQIRKDLSYLGSFGRRGVGYDVEELLQGLSDQLRLSRVWRVAVVGCGRLGSSLAAHLSIAERNFRVCAVFDCSARRVGAKVAGLEVLSWEKIPAAMRERGVDMAIIATPPLAAQGVADLIVESGVRLILNFAPISLSVPESVTVRGMDLADELQALSMHSSAKRTGRARDSARPTVSWIKK